MKSIFGLLIVPLIATKLVVLSPLNLVHRLNEQKTLKYPRLVAEIDTSYANFGLIPYGHSMVSLFEFLILQPDRLSPLRLTKP